MRALLVILVLAASSPVQADVEPAREDIVDIRRGRMPSRSAVLGWTDTGAFVFRRTTCTTEDLSDQPSCNVEIEVAERAQTRRHPLFSAWWEIGCTYRDPPPASALGCWKIPTEAARRFIAAERQLRARLGPLTPGTAIARDLPGGRIEGVRYSDERADRRRAAIVLADRGRWRPLRVIWSSRTEGNQFLRRDPTVQHVERSPDGNSLAIVSALAHADTDFYWESYRVDVVPMP